MNRTQRIVRAITTEFGERGGAAGVGGGMPTRGGDAYHSPEQTFAWPPRVSVGTRPPPVRRSNNVMGAANELTRLSSLLIFVSL